MSCPWRSQRAKEIVEAAEPAIDAGNPGFSRLGRGGHCLLTTGFR